MRDCSSISASLTISVQQPYKILATSCEICDVLGYSSQEFQARNINFLFGPDTDPTCIPKTIKQLLANRNLQLIDIPCLKIYDRTGKENLCKVECKIETDIVNGGSTACLKFEWPRNVSSAHPVLTLPATRDQFDAKDDFDLTIWSHQDYQKQCHVQTFGTEAPKHDGNDNQCLDPSYTVSAVASLRERATGDWHDDLEYSVMLLDALSIADRGHLPTPAATVDISVQPPHKILSVSRELCAMIGLDPHRMVGRSVGLLFGPKTDPAAVPAAVKRLHADGMRQTIAIPALTVYRQNGAPLVVSAVCARTAADAGAFRLRLELPAEPMARGPPSVPAWIWQ